MNNCTKFGRITSDIFFPYKRFPLKRSNSKLFSLVLISLILILIIFSANSQANTDDDLVQAAYTGELRKVRSLITKRVDINQTDSKGKTALMASSAQGHLDIVETLLSKGANINFQPKKGLTP